MASAEIQVEDWPELLRELRQCIFEAGFTDWDAQAVAAIDEGDATDRTKMTSYLGLFLEHLKSGSNDARNRTFQMLPTLVTDREGNHLQTAYVSDSEGREFDLNKTALSDDLIENLAALSSELLEGSYPMTTRPMPRRCQDYEGAEITGPGNSP